MINPVAFYVRYMAYIMDTNEEERAKVFVIPNYVVKFLHEKSVFALLTEFQLAFLKTYNFWQKYMYMIAGENG